MKYSDRKPTHGRSTETIIIGAGSGGAPALRPHASEGHGIG
jgi:hypothetical protein